VLASPINKKIFVVRLGRKSHLTRRPSASPDRWPQLPIMRKVLFVASLLFCQTSFCQHDSIYAKIEVTSVSWEEYRTWIDTSIIIIIEQFGRTQIISLGKIDSLEIGFQIELSKSRLGDSDIIVSGKAYYFRKGGKWRMHYQPTYQSVQFKIVSEKPLTIPPDDYGGSVTTIHGLQVEYRERYFIIK